MACQSTFSIPSLVFLLAIAAASQAGCATATTDDPAVTQETGARPVAEATPGSDDEIVCKRDKVGDTRIAKKICMTREQWADIEEASQRETRKMQSGGVLGGSGP